MVFLSRVEQRCQENPAKPKGKLLVFTFYVAATLFLQDLHTLFTVMLLADQMRGKKDSFPKFSGLELLHTKWRATIILDSFITWGPLKLLKSWQKGGGLFRDHASNASGIRIKRFFSVGRITRTDCEAKRHGYLATVC